MQKDILYACVTWNVPCKFLLFGQTLKHFFFKQVIILLILHLIGVLVFIVTSTQHLVVQLGRVGWQVWAVLGGVVLLSFDGRDRNLLDVTIFSCAQLCQDCPGSLLAIRDLYYR